MTHPTDPITTAVRLLTAAASSEHLAAAQALQDFAESLGAGGVQPLRPAPAAHVEPMFWVRLRSDGGYEGPIHTDAIERVRAAAGTWQPLYLGAAPQQAAQAGWVLVPSDLLQELAPDQPMNQDEMGGCVWCGGTPPGKRHGNAGADPSHHDANCPWVAARALISPAPQQAAPAATDALTEALQSLEWHKRRCDALQAAQSKMRDPERTMVCDILANGRLLEPAGDRYTAPQQAAPAVPSDASDVLPKVCDLFGIGKAAREESTILANVENAIRHAGLLHALERDLFPQPELPDDDDPYATVDDELPAPNSWGAKDETDYVSQFRAALLARGFAAPQQAAPAERAYLVATGRTNDAGNVELYERHDKFVPLADCEVLYTTAPQPPGLVPLDAVLARVDDCAGPNSAVRLALEREFGKPAA